jgi:hypothetical protein
MNVFALFVILLSCFSRVFADSHAARTRKIIAGDHHAVNEYCYRSKDHVAYYYGKEAVEACARHKEKLAQKRREEEENRKRMLTCRKASGCDFDDSVSCTEEVLRECEDTFVLWFQKKCVKNHEEFASIESMSDWFGPLKWIYRFMKQHQMEYSCGLQQRY